MYLSHFHLEREPFSLTPDPRFLFLSERHREALAHLLYGLGERGGFVQLTGEVGTGKTTLCRSLLDQVPEGVDVALILNPRLTALELVSSVCDELGVLWPAGTQSLKELVDVLNRHLLDAHARGRRTVLVIDEAQQLSADVLEQVRLLTNLETPTAKLLQIVLIGQPELQSLMARPELRQLAQRVTARYHLMPLGAEETVSYVRHRLAVAGGQENPFTRAALRKLRRLSGGIPRLINVICDRALLGAYALDKRKVGARLLSRAADEVLGRPPVVPVAKTLAWASAATLAAGLAIFSLWGDEVPAFRFNNAPRAAVAVSPKVPVARSLDEWIRDGGTKGESAHAVATLFRLWHMPQNASSAPEEQAAAAGLAWVEGRGDWTQLERYNRPVSLELVSGTRACYAVAFSLEGRRVGLDFGGSRGEFSRGDVDRFWTGRFSLVWKPPPQGAEQIREGVAGPAVGWLRKGLDLSEGLETRVSSGDSEDSFGVALRRRVVAFQRKEGLLADGLVGPQTLVPLSSLAWESTLPVLRTPKGRS